MDNNSPQLQSILRDISDIRRAISRAETKEASGQYARDLSAHRTIYLAAMVLAFIFLAFELLIYPSLTDRLYATHFIEKFRYIAIAMIFALLAALTLMFYVIVGRAARRADESFEEYVYRHFSYLRNLSFVSDLFVKFAGVALIILAGRPDWVAPLLLIYTGDYLLQGRFFLLPVRLGLSLGILAIVGGMVQLVWFEGHLVYPLVAFLILLFLSFAHIKRLNVAVFK